jgi:hypothetical protein
MADPAKKISIEIISRCDKIIGGFRRLIRATEAQAFFVVLQQYSELLR